MMAPAPANFAATGDPSTWAAAPAPSAVAVRSGAGAGGSARVEVTWADGAITNKWLQVTLKADSVTGLAGADVFYVGNLVADADGSGTVDTNDYNQTVRDQGLSGVPVTQSDDFNKDGSVSTADYNDVTRSFGDTLPILTVPTQARTYYGTSYFDAADRMTDGVNVGTNGGAAYTRPASVPSGSDTVLVNHTDYDNGGRVLDTVDPRGIKAGNFYDLLGRSTETIAAWDGTQNPTPGNSTNQITNYTYDGNGDVLSMTAVQPTGGATPNQTTAYVYGVGTTVGTDLFSNDVIKTVEYPDLSTGSPSTSPSNDVSYGYDLRGESTGVTDRNGSVHGYTYDVLGRLKLDAVTTLGSGVDGSIRSLGYNYTALGLPYQQTSYSDNGGTTVVNQVQDVYNGFGQLLTQYQEHSGAVNTGTSLKVQYAYASGTNFSRLSSMTYPNGRVLNYVYNSGLDSDISRVSGLSDAAGTGAGNDQSYTYLGLNTIVQATDGNGIALSYIKQPGDTLAGSDGGDQYTGLDRFGRVSDQNWVNTSTGVSTDRFQYGYDRNSNVLYKNNLVNSTFSELYHANSASSGDNNTAYDNLNRISGFRRGTLSSSGHNGTGLDTVATLNTNANSSQSWSLDALGNQTSVTTDGTGTGRTLNGQNQITAVGTTSLAYDNNGNTTTDENGRTLVYDAWNRLVAVKNGSTTIASYKYDAAGNRIQQTENAATTDLYYSTKGQVLEERQGSTVTIQNVWGLMYVNDLALRDDNGTSGNYGITGSGLGRRIYDQQDATWNVTALVDTSGNVLERFLYTPYGVKTVLSSSWAVATDVYGVLNGFQGGRQDAVTGLIHFAAGTYGRDYDPYLGVWTQPDLVYNNVPNLYQSDDDNPLAEVDPNGTYPTSHPYCKALADKIRAKEADIAKREAEMLEDKLKLPWRAPGDVQNPGLSRWGHQQIINQLKKDLESDISRYKNECQDPPPPCPIPQPVPRPRPLPKITPPKYPWYCFGGYPWWAGGDRGATDWIDRTAKGALIVGGGITIIVAPPVLIGAAGVGAGGGAPALAF